MSATAPGNGKRLESRLAVFPDYFRVPVGASWKTRVIGRFPKNGKPWNKAKNDHMRLSSEVRMMNKAKNDHMRLSSEVRMIIVVIP